MKKFLILLTLLFTNLFSYESEVNKIIENYENKNYDKICTEKVANLYLKLKDDGLTNIYAHSCLELDMLNRLINPIVQLHKTPEARANAAYYSTILLQKKLLYHALIDNVDISYARFPQTNYILSQIFDNYVLNNYEKNNNILIFKEKDGTLHELYLDKIRSDLIKLVIKTYKNNVLEKTRYYW